MNKKTIAKIKGKKILIIPLIFFPAFLVYLKTSAVVEQKHPHPFMNDEKHTYCSECHDQDPNTITDYRDVRLTRGTTASCLRGDDKIAGFSCHSEGKLGRSHPVDIEPDININVPEDLHLDERLQITCATCHDPHGDWTSTQPMTARATKITGTNLYPSYFLRRTNVGGVLCISCHADH